MSVKIHYEYEECDGTMDANGMFVGETLREAIESALKEVEENAKDGMYKKLSLVCEFE
jgi:hypothetical protein